MRKHFLLLMMTLLSVTAFAETDISSDPKVSMSTGNVVFDGGVAPAIQLLYDGYKMTSPADYTWDGKYYTTSACTVDAGAIGDLEVGTYYVKVVGAGVYTGTRVASFDVTKKPIEVNLVAPLAKTYGDADPALEDANIDWTGAAFKAPDDKTVFTGTLTYTYENGNVGLHTISVTGLNAKNYTLKVNGGLTITPKAIAAGMITPVTLSEIYKGATFTEFAVNIKDGSKPLVAGTDFNLGVYTTEDVDVAVAAGQPFNVGTYYLGISSKAGANYSVAATTLVGTFEITQAGLTVRALNQTMVYNGTKTLPSYALDEAYQLIGVQGDDAFTGLTLTVDGDKNFGTHTITPSALLGTVASNYTDETAKAYNAKLPGAVKAGDIQTPAVLYADAAAYNTAKGTALTDEQFAALSEAEKTETPAVLYDDATAAAANALLPGAVNTTMADITTATNVANYDLNYVEGTLNITKRALTITAADAKKVYKKAENTVKKMDNSAADAIGYGGVTFTSAPAYVGDLWDINTDPVGAADIVAMKAEYNKGAGTAAEKAYRGTLRVTRTGAGTDENKGDYEDALTITKDNNGKVWDNYEVDLVAGDFHIVGGKLYITALHQSKNYGAADPSWTAVEEKAGNENPNYRVDGISAPDVVTGVTLTRTEGENVGTYDINISATGVPTGYEDIVFVPATFTINARPLAVAAHIQTLKIGDTAGNLDQTAYDILSTDPNEGLIDGDEASEVFSLAIAGGVTQPLDDVNVIANGIVKGAGSDVAKSANYAITFIPGTLIVIDPTATIALNRPKKDVYNANPESDDAASVIATAAAAKFTTAAQVNQYNAALGGAVTAGEETGEVYDATTAAAYNATLPGAVAAGDDTGADYDAASANAYNATLTGAITTTTVLTADQATALNGIAGVSKTTYAAGDTPDIDADCNLYNATLTGHVSVGDDILYTAETAALHNAGLGGHVDVDDPILYTAETAAIYNANLDGAKAIGDQRPFAVTFGDFDMIAEKWYPIVLPFETSVREVSEAFGYAIVNILKKDNTDETKIAFKLHMGNIPANEPFVVKVYEDINMNEVFFGNPMLPFADGKFIVNSAAPEVTDNSGVKFIGSYSKKVGFDSNEAFFSVSASKNDYYWGNTGVNKTYMAPLSAYFQIPANSSAREIVFEEPDGSTTTIEAISAAKVANSNDAIYNLAGQKVGADYKGIVIKNGKRFVQK